MPDIELTSAELEEALTELETHQTQLDMDGIMVGVSRQALDMVITTARAGLEARKAEESMREKAATVADDMRNKFGSPTGDAYSNGLWDQGVRIATAIRALPLTGDET